MQCGLHLLPDARAGQRLCDRHPKLPEETAVRGSVTSGRAAAVAVHLLAHKVAQDGARGFVAGMAGRKKPLPQLGITGERGGMCHHLCSMLQGG